MVRGYGDIISDPARPIPHVPQIHWLYVTKYHHHLCGKQCQLCNIFNILFHWMFLRIILHCMEMEYSFKCHISCSRVWCQGWVDSRSFLLDASLWGLGGSGSGERRARKRRIRRKRRRGATSWMPPPSWAGAALWGSSAWSAIPKIWKDPWNSRGHSWDSLRTTIACFQPDTNLIFHPREASASADISSCPRIQQNTAKSD